MRELVKTQIVRQFNRGIDELNISRINFMREKNNQPLIPENPYEATEKWEDYDIQKVVDMLTDEELLIVLDAQACLIYR